MGKYYGFGAISAVALFIIMFLVTGIHACSVNNDRKALKEQALNETIVIRYFMTDDYEHSDIKYIQFNENEKIDASELPKKEGYVFSGLYDGPDYITATPYVTSEGFFVKSPTSEILLYPVFTEETK